MDKPTDIVRDPFHAIQHAIEITDNETAIVVCGSFYLASSFQNLV
jgi:folylpolyglutamate synthase/dihydropteroate synthase